MKTFYVYVNVVGEASDPEDENLPGIYEFEVKTTFDMDVNKISKEESAVIYGAVMDSFHDQQSVEEIDDFAFRIYLENGLEIFSEDVETDFDCYATYSDKVDEQAPAEVHEAISNGGLLNSPSFMG